MKAYYTDHFVLPLPPDHRFPMQKYARLREQILKTDLLEASCLQVPEAATDTQILRAHDRTYLEKVKHGTLSRKEIIRTGFPWSPEMVERSRRSSGATIAAVQSALLEGVAVNLAGGTHHAGRDHGEGYCIWNDSVIAAREHQASGAVKQVIVIDCDVHQGNGTAAITQHDPTIYSVSIHGEKNFPFRKVYGDLDIGLQENASDEDYLTMLEIALERALFAVHPDLAIYIAGADAHELDTLGKLNLSTAGMAARDRMVMEACFERRIPVAVTMGGGYAAEVDDIVAIHLQTVAIARDYWQKWRQLC